MFVHDRETMKTRSDTYANITVCDRIKRASVNHR